MRTIGKRKAPEAPYTAGQSEGLAWKIKLREEEIQSMGIKINNNIEKLDREASTPGPPGTCAPLICLVFQEKARS